MAATESIVASQEVDISMDILDGKKTLVEVVEEVTEGQSQELANHRRDDLPPPDARGDGQSFLPSQEKNGATSQLVRPGNHHADRNQPAGRGHFKRRHASSSYFKRGGPHGPHHLKWRRKTVETEPIVLPSDFLLGGSITDPLNLNSMQDEEVNRMLNANTPKSSPLPNRAVIGDVGLVIPGDVTDPLHLNQETPKSGKKRRHKRRRRRSEGDLDDSEHYIEEETTEGIETECKPLIMDSKEAVSKEGCPEQIPGGKDKERVSPKDKVSPVSFPHGHKRTWHNSGRTDDVQVTPGSDTNHTPKRRSKSGEKEMIPKEEIVSPVISPDHEKRRGVEPTRIVSRALLIENHPSKDHRSHRRTPDKGRGNHVGSQHKKQPEPGVPAPHFRTKDQLFQYGNYNRYYGYRNPAKEEDVRLSYFRPEWFKGLDVLDIGCNAGHLTLSIARDYAPRKIVGMDIDQSLIRVARRNIRHYLAPEARDSFPVSMTIQYGPMAAGGLVGEQVATQFPNNVFFTQANYAPDSDSRVQAQQPEYDVILALSLTKWIHLNWGDAAMKRTFQRVFRQLRPGGRFIVEPQPWKSYGRKKKLTERIFANYKQIQFRPHQFVDYLLSAEVGFSSCRQLEGPRNKSKGFRRPVYMLTKAPAAPP
ncbi:MEPCE [Branchiostoma lanceolatum]|uniref:RNA methyltransferase n=1 Tax=Branchiostoma lanceolatum TaxID=7740 RepID=A0A8J9VKM8_BRALA|nr:MEPCE [Branchiostoma lanceolatum]